MTNLWKDWLEKQTDHRASDLPKRIQQIRQMHGQRNEKICGDCVHFRALNGYAKTYYKCDLSKLSHGSGTDWRAHWPACGKWLERGDQ